MNPTRNLAAVTARRTLRRAIACAAASRGLSVLG
jgi:hypothetical protein